MGSEEPKLPDVRCIVWLDGCVAAHWLNELWLDPNGVGFICVLRGPAIFYHELKMPMLINGVDSEGLAKRALEYFRCADTGRITQRGWNLYHANKITDFEVGSGLHHLTRTR